MGLERFKTSAPSSISKTWSRRYPPITVALIAALLIAIIVLPSALNIPQTNPTTVAEYAPVPPEDDSPPDTSGNVSSLGLGTSSSLQKGTPSLPSDLGPTEGQKRVQKRCVGKPARQTEDPMAPPCVPFFQGNNGGATWTGVTKDEIVVVAYGFTGGGRSQTNCTTSFSCDPGGTAGNLCDLDKPPNTDPNCFPEGESHDHWAIRILRPLVRHFNIRYQTYDRRVHMWYYHGAGGSAADRRAQASAIYQRLKPFATISLVDFFTDALTARKVMAFGGVTGFQPNSLYRKNAPYLWAFGPDIEHWVDQYANYVCSKVAGKPVAHTEGTMDGAPMKGKPRVYGFMHTSMNSPALNAFRDQVRPKLAECGITPATEVTFPNAGWVEHTGGDNTYAPRNVARLQDAKVTTLLWFSGLETRTGKAADQVGYYPEIVFAPDGNLDGILGGGAQNQNFWRNAWGPAPTLFPGSLREDAPGYQACKEGDPNLSADDCQTSSNIYYRNVFMLFKGIQAAGPRLNPANVDKGMHSIPRQSSTSPLIASCYFDPGDYTCVKDGVEHWWDPDAQSPYWSGPGCLRMTYGGNRFLPGEWPQDDQPFKSPQDPCGPVVGNALIGAGTPTGPS